MAYSPQQFAKVFAEVTTYATPLNPIHEDWLRFAFRLGPYESPAGGTETSRWKAMATVAKLCERQNVGANDDANPFHDRIQFNPELDLTNCSVGGFAYTAVYLTDLILGHYYTRPSSALSPDVLAEQVALALLALTRNDTSSSNTSAFFGDVAHRQRYLWDGFLIGILNYLRCNGVPASWDAVLQALKFNLTSWDVTPWVVTTGGNSGNVSRTVANNVFEYAFGKGSLPTGVGDMPTFLSGDNAELTFRASALTPKGRPSKTVHNDTTFPVNGNKALNVDPTDISNSSMRRITLANSPSSTKPNRSVLTTALPSGVGESTFLRGVESSCWS